MRGVRSSLVGFVIASVVLASSGTAYAGGDLDKVESAHTDKGGSSPTGDSRSGKGSHDSGGGIVSGILGALFGGASDDESGDADASAPAPSHGLSMYSYTADGPPRAYTITEGPSARMRRYGELSFSGFTEIPSHVQALDAQLNVFLSALTIHAAITRYYEPDATRVTSLDLLRFQVGFNILHGLVNGAELHLTGGVLGLHGNTWTPGGSARADLRLYPVRPVSVDFVVDTSFFAHGPPLVEAQLMPGVTFARLDLRAGVGALYQQGVSPIYGPRISIGIRF